MTAFTVTLLGDLTGTAFGGTPTFTDYTGYLELGDDGQPIEVPWGRNDRDAEVEPTTFSFVLANPDGRFTTGASVITTAHRFRVQVTVGGTTYSLADGYVEQVEALWPGGVQSWSVVRVTCTDVSARLGDGAPLRSFYEQTALSIAGGAAGLWPLAEPSGSTRHGNASLTSQRSGRSYPWKYGGGAAAGADPVIADEVTSVALSADSAEKAGVVELPNLLGASGPWTVALCFNAAAAKSWAQTLWQTSRPGPGGVSSATSTLSIDPLGGLNFVVVPDSDTSGIGNSTSFPTGQNLVTDGLDHIVICVMLADNRTLRMYLDGAMAPNFYDVLSGAAIPMTRQARAKFIVGAAVPNGGSTMYGLDGRVGMIAVWPTTALTGPQVLQLTAAAQGFPGESSDTRFARIAGYAGISTSGLPAGKASMGAQPIAGLPAIEALRTVARTEGQPMLVTGTGALTFQARGARYWPGIAASLSADDLDGDLTVRLDRQGLVNDVTYQRYGGSAQRVYDSASVAQYGRRSGSPGEVAPAQDYDALQRAAWDVRGGKSPGLRLSTIGVDLLAQPAPATVQALLAVTVGSVLSVSGLPSQTPGGSTTPQFVEGGKLTIGRGQLDAEFYTSPVSTATTNVLRADGSPTFKTKLDAGLVIGF